MGRFVEFLETSINKPMFGVSGDIAFVLSGDLAIRKGIMGIMQASEVLKGVFLPFQKP
jgi:hypothetical protein